MASCKLTFKVEWAWWWPVYWYTVMTLVYLLDCEPNMERVGYWMNKAVRLTLIDDE